MGHFRLISAPPLNTFYPRLPLWRSSESMGHFRVLICTATKHVYLRLSLWRCSESAPNRLRRLQVPKRCEKGDQNDQHADCRCQKCAKNVPDHAFWHDLARACVPPSGKRTCRGSTSRRPLPALSLWLFPIQWANKKCIVFMLSEVVCKFTILRNFVQFPIFNK